MPVSWPDSDFFFTHADGYQALASDDTWRYRDGPIRSARIYGGEEYDARLELAGWESPRLLQNNSGTTVDTYSVFHD